MRAARSSITLQAPLFPLSSAPGVPVGDIASEAQLVALACRLGAESCGGDLSPAERALILDVRRTDQEDMAVAEIVDSVRDAIRAGHDPLGDAFCRLRPAPVRRKDGAFYTPPALVSAMLDWLLTHPLARVVDPGCGSGRFAMAVARRRPDLPLIAVDSDPLATLLTRASLAALGAMQARVLHYDYLSLALPACDGPTGYVANPPYVRHHDLSPEAKAWATSAGRRLGISVSGLSGLHTLFFLATALGARPGDAGCFVTSAEWLDTRYGAAIRRLLVERLGLHALATLHPRSVPFADAMTTAAIAGFVVGTTPPQVAVDTIDVADDLDLPKLRHAVERQRLADAQRWSVLLRQGEFPQHAGRTGHAVPLRTAARVHRGVATGRNEFFVLTRERAARLGLLPWCRPAITGAEEILRADGVVRDGPERRLLLVVPREVDRRAHPALDAYLRSGETARDGNPAVAEGYLARHRSPWWYLGPVTAPPIVASYMARQAPAFALNPDGLALINIAHGIYPREPLDADALRDLVRQLNSARAGYTGQGRTYHGGLEKFEPREMEELLIEVPRDATVR